MVRSTIFAFAFLFASALAALAEDATPPSAGPQPPAGEPTAVPPTGAGPAGPAVPEDLESLLALAMRGNPEILVAEAKVAQAEAEAHAARLRISHAVLEARAEQAEAVRRRAAAEKSASMTQARVNAGHVSTEEGDRASEALAEAKAAVAEVEARLRFLCGTGTGEARGGAAASETAVRVRLAGLASAGQGKAVLVTPPASIAPVGGVSESNVLDRPVLIPAFNGETMTLRSALDQIRAATGLLIVLDLRAFGEEPKEMLDLKFSLSVRQAMPLRALLDAVADSVEWSITFVPRQYGVLLTQRAN
jgi:hypothetical protein